MSGDAWESEWAVDMNRRLKLVVTVDVEEEGLFTGRYPRVPPGVKNVYELRRIEFITREFGFPLTLLVTYPAAVELPCAKILRSWHRELGAELGAHLHPWSTPPFADLPCPEPVRSDLMPESLLRAKLESLKDVLESRLEVRAASFRMGRFDLGEGVRRLLPTCGFHTDSSVVPCRLVDNVADHFMAGNEPFWWGRDEGEGNSLLEVPLTQLTFLPELAARLYRVSQRLTEPRRLILHSAFRALGVVGIQPAWYPLSSMQWAARLHHARGGKVLTMFLHSTELLPGANPDYPTEAAVRRLTGRIRQFLQWLTTRYSIEGVTLSQLHHSLRAARQPPPRPQTSPARESP
jgi:hypothetical protein